MPGRAKILGRAEPGHRAFLPSITSVYEPVEEFWKVHWPEGLPATAGDDAGLRPIDAMILHHLLGMMPDPALLVDLSARYTSGAVSLIGLAHDRVARVLASCEGDERVAGALGAKILECGSTPIEIVAATRIGDLTAVTSPVVVVIDAREGERSEIGSAASRWLDLKPDVLVVVIGLGRVQNGSALTHFLSLGAGTSFGLVRERGESLAASTLGLLSRSGPPLASEILDRLQALFAGNFGVLELLKAVNIAAIREAQVEAETMRAHVWTWALTAEMDQLRAEARSANHHASESANAADESKRMADESKRMADESKRMTDESKRKLDDSSREIARLHDVIREVQDQKAAVAADRDRVMFESHESARKLAAEFALEVERMQATIREARDDAARSAQATLAAQDDQARLSARVAHAVQEAQAAHQARDQAEIALQAARRDAHEAASQSSETVDHLLRTIWELREQSSAAIAGRDEALRRSREQLEWLERENAIPLRQRIRRKLTSGRFGHLWQAAEAKPQPAVKPQPAATPAPPAPAAPVIIEPSSLPPRLESLLSKLSCTHCRGGLKPSGRSLACIGCGTLYPIVDGRPVFSRDPEFSPRIMPVEHISNQPPQEFLDWMAGLDGWVLNIGAGGTKVKLSNAVEVEYAVFRHTDVVSDAHHLPFPDASFDAVVTFNTFEHLADPPRAAAEIFRVLKPGGRLVLHTAFLQPLHESPHHYYNTTEWGLRRWFDAFEIADVTVSPNFQPAHVMAWLASEWLMAVNATEGPQAWASLASSTLETWANAWADPSRREADPLWQLLARLPMDQQKRWAAGFQLEARKPMPA